MSASAVSLQAVVKHYAEGERLRRVLDGVDVAFAPARITALLGRSGSGKSTLLNLMAGIDAPDAGRVEVAGRDLACMSERERTLFRRRHIGFVYQFFNLIDTLSVAENVALPLELLGLRAAERRRRVADMLTAVGLADRADSRPQRLSGGEQQRVAIARALVHAPKLILADEPTGNLDEENGVRVLDLLTALVREHAATLIVVTHSDEVAARADRVLRLHEGHLQEVVA
jgi:putative ABC transport system ATP-binding protein